jgi:uncharacterized protein
MDLGTGGSSPSLLLGACVGLVGGLTSGLCGISPGGALVVLSGLLLGAEQHVAQGISLAAQIPPTSLSGIQRYRKEGSGHPVRWLLWLAPGFLSGGVVGALVAGKTSSVVLQWSYVGYLVALDVMLVVRALSARATDVTTNTSGDPSGFALAAVGLLAGLSSGYLGIGGGLVVVVGLSGVLGVPQHRAQLASLALSLIPTTIPAAWVYWRAGELGSWPILIAVVFGLWAGTDLGARAATRMPPHALRVLMVVMVSAMATYMAWKALEV